MTNIEEAMLPEQFIIWQNCKIQQRKNLEQELSIFLFSGIQEIIVRNVTDECDRLGRSLTTRTKYTSSIYSTLLPKIQKQYRIEGKKLVTKHLNVLKDRLIKLVEEFDVSTEFLSFVEEWFIPTFSLNIRNLVSRDSLNEVFWGTANAKKLAIKSITSAIRVSMINPDYGEDLFTRIMKKYDEMAQKLTIRNKFQQSVEVD